MTATRRPRASGALRCAHAGTTACRSRTTRSIPLGLTVGLVIGILVFVSGGVPSAAAGYGALATGDGVSQAGNIPVPSAPVAVAVGTTVTVSWTSITLSGGQPVDGYVVERLDTLGTAVAVLPACNVLITSTTCTESAVPAGTWQYRVRGVRGSWSGASSAPSAPITVLTATVAWSTPMPLLALPATLNGTITNFVVGETLSFRLDSPTGTVLAGSPTVVTTAAGQAVSVTLPAGTTDAPHSIYVVGSLGTVAAAAVSIVIPPALVSLTMHDVDVDGRVDEVRVTFDDVLAPYSAGTASWTLTNIPSGGTLTGVTVSGAVATLAIAEGSGAASTAVGTFTIALSANAAGIRDVHGHTSSFAARAPADLAPPASIAMVLQDSNSNGRVNRVLITWSETLAATSTITAPWTLANVPSGGTLASVSASGTAATITITEGTGALDTAVGSMTVALAANAAGPRDAAGNLSVIAARAPSDGARPLLLSFADTNGATDGRIEPADTLSLTFTEPIAPGSVPASVTVTLTDPNTTAADRLTITGIANGARTTGGNGYVTTNNVSFGYAGSAVSFTAGGRTMVITVGTTCTGTCTAIGTQTTAATLSMQPATSITDTAGNLVLTTTRSASIRLF